MNVWGITHRGVVREENQDAYAVEVLSDHEILAVVCDGMGGARAGNVASTMAVDTFMEEFHQHKGDGLPTAALLRQAAAQANETVHHRSMVDPSCFGMGTTMVAVLLEGDQATILNEGDSRAYRIGPKGIVRITRDHSMVEDMVQRGDLTPDQARTHPHKNLITRALGSEAKLRADLFEVTVEAGEYLLLCSDGLSNTLTDDEMLQQVLYGGAEETCCQRLLDLSISRGAPDNVTAALIRC